MAFNHPFSGASIILSKRLLLALFAPLFVCLSIKSQVNHWETVVYDTDTWRYLVPNSAVNPEWINLNFNEYRASYSFYDLFAGRPVLCLW